MESKRRSSIQSRKQNPRLRILEPELPAISGLPKNKKEPLDFNDSDSSTCCVSAYYIPGITGKARCLEDTKIRRRPRRSSTKTTARGLYAPSSSSNSGSNRSLPLLDVAYASDDNDEELSALLARSLPGDLTLGNEDDDESEQLSVETLQARETIGRTKVQLETQLGSIRGLLEDHISRTGVKTFKELQSKRKSRRHTERTVSSYAATM